MRKSIWMFGILTLLCGCSSPSLQRQTFTVELGKDIYANAALYIKNPENYRTEDMEVVAVSSGVVKKQNRFTYVDLDYLVAGEYDFKIVGDDFEIPFSISVKDTQAPTIEDCPDTIEVDLNESINWSSFIQASDLSGVTYTTDVTIDTSHAQTTPVKLRISDRFGNAVTRTVTVIVS